MQAPNRRNIISLSGNAAARNPTVIRARGLNSPAPGVAGAVARASNAPLNAWVRVSMLDDYEGNVPYCRLKCGLKYFGPLFRYPHFP